MSLCVCVCFCVCVCVQFACLYMCVTAHVGSGGRLVLMSKHLTQSCLHLVFWDRVSHWTFSTPLQLDCVVSVNLIFTWLSPQHWGCRQIPLWLDLMWVLGIQNEMLMLTWWALYWLSLPARHPYFCFTTYCIYFSPWKTWLKMITAFIVLNVLM